MTVDEFRAAYPEFSDGTKYPDAAIQRQLTIAALRLNACRWADLLETGIGLFVAHFITLAGKGATVAASIASKSAGGLSVSYNSDAVSFTNAGHWNGTGYGLQFYELARMVGAGPIQL